MKIYKKITTTKSITHSFTVDEIVNMLISLGKLPKNVKVVELALLNNEIHIDFENESEKEMRMSHEQIAFLNTPISELVYDSNKHMLSKTTQKALKTAKMSTLMQCYRLNKVEFILKPNITKPIIAELAALFKKNGIEFKD
jgi:hypothetical protein